ncbi:MAG TPA: hypothetical protein VFP84_23545, partial [Kofleriaceae bacterium]|nr:hypothetical protein [Kofleriaceae bacterium]
MDDRRDDPRDARRARWPDAEGTELEAPTTPSPPPVDPEGPTHLATPARPIGRDAGRADQEGPTQ